MDENIHRSHNVSVLIVCPAKYRRVVFSKEVDESLKEIYLEIVKRCKFAWKFERTKTIYNGKGNLAGTPCEEKIWGEEFRSDGYYVNIISRIGSEVVIKNYVWNQGVLEEYVELHRKPKYEQLELF